jgi:hypothetical protein
MRRLIQRLRLARGLHWSAETPGAVDLGIDAHGVLFAMIVVLLFGCVDLLDRWNEQRIAAESAQEQYALQQTAMLACLNGGAPGYYTTDSAGHRHYIVCQTFTVSDENTRSRM